MPTPRTSEKLPPLSGANQSPLHLPLRRRKKRTFYLFLVSTSLSLIFNVQLSIFHFFLCSAAAALILFFQLSNLDFRFPASGLSRDCGMVKFPSLIPDSFLIPAFQPSTPGRRGGFDLRY